MSRIPQLSGVVLARNDADCIARCVASLTAICAEVVVLDAGSTDNTVARAAAAGARVEHQAGPDDFVEQANAAIALAQQPWVLLLDADEWLVEGAADGLRALFATNRVATAEIWTLERRVHFLGKVLRFGGVQSETVERLFRQPLRYWPAKINAKLANDGMRVRATGIRLEQDVAGTETELREELAQHALLFAEDRIARKKRSAKRSALTPYAHCGLYFLKSYIVRGGFLDGRSGWRYHQCQARHVFDKYRLLRELAAAA